MEFWLVLVRNSLGRNIRNYMRRTLNDGAVFAAAAGPAKAGEVTRSEKRLSIPKMFRMNNVKGRLTVGGFGQKVKRPSGKFIKFVKLIKFIK